MTKLLCWNINRGSEESDSWRDIANSDTDIALLQEARRPPEDLPKRLKVDPEPFKPGTSRCAIVSLSSKVSVRFLKPVLLNGIDQDGDFKTTHQGCISAAIVKPIDRDVEPFTAVSFCAEYEIPLCSSWKITDASIHRVISDLSLLIGKQNGHRIIAAGDLTISHGYGEDKSGYWKDRYDTVFDRMKAIGLPFVGPQYPHGRLADPRPQNMPPDSINVPTYCKSFRTNPAAAYDQLDYVFASHSMADSVKVRALNHPEEWGPSDHCRIEIEVE